MATEDEDTAEPLSRKLTTVERNARWVELGEQISRWLKNQKGQSIWLNKTTEITPPRPSELGGEYAEVHDAATDDALKKLDRGEDEHPYRAAARALADWRKRQKVHRRTDVDVENRSELRPTAA